MDPVDHVQDYLQLPPEQGGRRFGPLPDRVRLGGDPQRAALTLPTRPPLPPVAIELVRSDAGGWSVHHVSDPPVGVEIVPASAGARLGDDTVGRPARTGARLAPGDTLLLRLEGPGRPSVRLTLLRARRLGPPPLPDIGPTVELGPPNPPRPDASETNAAPLERPAASPPPREAAPDGSAWAGEAARQLGARAMHRSPLARLAVEAHGFFAQERWKNPVFLVGAAITAGTFLLGGLSALAFAVWRLVGAAQLP
jgi:hypothetical protein